MGPSKLRLVEAASPAPPGDFAGLFRTYAPYVATIALRILGRDDEVDDVVQDVFVVAMRGLSELRTREPHAVKGWLATVTVRKASRRLRRRRLWSLLRLSPSPTAMEPVSPGATPEEQALLGRVYAALDKLPVSERVAWTLRHVEGESLEGVAALCGCSLATAKRRIAAGKQSLSRMLSHE